MEDRLTPEENKQLFDFWARKKRGADGKVVRPCDASVLTEDEAIALADLPPTIRITAARLLIAEQQTG